MSKSNIVDIANILAARRTTEFDEAYGVILSKSYIDVTGEPNSKFGIEVYEKRQNVDACLCVSFGQDTRLAELTVDEAVELGEAILTACGRG